jgi:hypothetical protein
MRQLLAIAALLGLVACSHTFPIAVVTKDVPGGIMRGEGEVGLGGGHFSVSSGHLTCAGSYDGTDMSPTITVPVLCNDGRKGLITATRNRSGSGGGGRFTLNDGATGDFIFGPAALQL